MSITVQMPREEWAKRKLYVATPMYGGACMGHYVNSMLDLHAMCAAMGIEVQRNFLFNESLITRGRNYLAHRFLQSDCTHMLFCDGDIGFSAADMVTMLALMSDGNDYDVMAGVCPSKSINWDRVRQNAGDKAADLARLGNRYVVRLGDDVTSFAADRPLKVQYAGTGIMMIRRSTLERVRDANPADSYRGDTDYMRQVGSDQTDMIQMFFQCAIDPATHTYLSEDYWFCRQVQDCGMQVWVCPWMTFTHAGMYAFTGSLGDHVR